MRILVFGGSFDPPHVGHAALLAAADRAVSPDTILVVPAWRNPQKSRSPEDAEDRLSLAKLGLIDALPRARRARAWIDAGELSGGRPVYTVETLRRLAREFPGAELHFAAGWDAAVTFPTWKAPRELRALARWWTAARPGSAGTIPSFFKKLKAAMPDASSSEVRARLAAGDDVSGLLSPAVLGYIRREKLYGLDRLARLGGMLGAARFEHSRGVARLAGALARRWNEDEDRALLAGLLHDCGRAIPVARMAAYARAHKVSAPLREETARRAPLLLHAYVGEHVSRARFGVTDPAVLSAIRKHTLAAPKMSRLDTIVYVADACSEDRAYPEAPALRRLAFEDLPEAFRACVGQKLAHCMARGAWIHPETVTAWNRLAD